MKKPEPKMPKPERVDAVAGHGVNCQCIIHRAQRATGGQQA